MNLIIFDYLINKFNIKLLINLIKLFWN